MSHNRKKVTVNGKRIYRSHAVWNAAHPEDPVKPGEVIHHRDGDYNNDDSENLKKMVETEHKRKHGKEIDALAEWRIENPEEARKVYSKSAKRMLEILKGDPERYDAWRTKQRKATIAANKARALSPTERRRRRSEYMRKWRKRQKEKTHD